MHLDSSFSSSWYNVLFVSIPCLVDSRVLFGRIVNESHVFQIESSSVTQRKLQIPLYSFLFPAFLSQSPISLSVSHSYKMTNHQVDQIPGLTALMQALKF
jgi:hypothetical protein